MIAHSRSGIRPRAWRSHVGPLFATLLLAPAGTPAQMPTQTRPTLVVLIAVDQLRPDYFERFGHLTVPLPWHHGRGLADSVSLHRRDPAGVRTGGPASAIARRRARTRSAQHSLSGTDYIGHRYGPYSREAHDMFLRTDRVLGAFLDSPFSMRDSTRIILALTADHGVTPSRAGVDPAGNPRLDLRRLLSRYRARLATSGIDSMALDLDYGMVSAVAHAFASTGVDRDSLVSAFLADARKEPGVLRAELLRDLERADTTDDAIARRWLHSLPRDMDFAATITLRPDRFWPAADYANHGTPHDYDARVPILLWGSPFRASHASRSARTVDIAPTLAAALGIAPAEPLHGRVLTGILR